jgi:hypothetical protein
MLLGPLMIGGLSSLLMNPGFVWITQIEGHEPGDGPENVFLTSTLRNMTDMEVVP